MQLALRQHVVGERMQTRSRGQQDGHDNSEACGEGRIVVRERPEQERDEEGYLRRQTGVLPSAAEIPGDGREADKAGPDAQHDAVVEQRAQTT